MYLSKDLVFLQNDFQRLGILGISPTKRGITANAIVLSVTTSVRSDMVTVRPDVIRTSLRRPTSVVMSDMIVTF